MTDLRANATLERQSESDRVTAALHAAAGGQGSLVVIEGPPGIGKSRLVADTRELATSMGFARMRAVGDEPEAGLAWGVVRQLVVRSILRYSGDTRRKILAGPAGRALEALDAAPTDLAAADAALARALHALWWVAADLSADRPVLITVDDAQWADEPSLRFLVYLARRLEDLSVALVVATRPPAQATGPLAELCSGRGGERLLPEPLSVAAVADIAAAREGAVDPAVAAALHAASGGNPFYVGQLLAELQRAEAPLADPATAAGVAALGPRTVSRSLLLRLQPAAVRLAGAAAVLGAASDPAAAAAIAGLDDATAAPAAAELRAEHVMRPDALELRFVHPVLRESVLAELDTTERTALHAEAARRLRAAGADAEVVAEHLAWAPVGTLPGAAALLGPVAARALANGDGQTAVRLLRRALAEAPGDADLQTRLGVALLRTGGQAEAKPLLEAAVAVAADDAERAHRLGHLAEAQAGADGVLPAATALAAALDGGVVTDPAARLALEAHLGIVASFLLDGVPGSGARLEALVDGLSGATRDERTLLALVAQRRLNTGEPQARVREIAARVIASSPGRDADRTASLPWTLAVNSLSCADAFEEAQAALADGRRALSGTGTPVDFAAVAAGAASVAWRMGDVQRTDEEASAGVAALRMHEPGPLSDAITATVVRYAVLCAIERGDLAEAASLLDRLDLAGDSVPVRRIAEARAELALARDDPETARLEALRLGEQEAAAGAENATVPWRLQAARALLRLGRTGEAAELLAAAAAVAERWGGRGEVGAVLRLRARLEEDARIEHLTRAVAVLDGAPARLELARALCDLGDALRVGRRPAEGREPLHRGADLAAQLGAVALQRRAALSLDAMGERRRDLPRAGAEALTAGERRVAGLAARGRTNRDIAQELFVTPKTVENHLGRVYSKLGVSGRRALAGALDAAPAVTDRP